MRNILLAVFCCCLPIAALRAADPAPARGETAADQRLASLTQQQLELAFSLQEQARQHDTLWLNPRYTSPEINELRKRYDAIKRELAETEARLRACVDELPEVKAEQAGVARQRDAYQALGRQIEELKKQRASAR